jgi:hypothetical protein
MRRLLEQFRKFGIHYEPSAKPKSQLYVDLLPLITIPDAILLCASSPHARRGALWEAHRKVQSKATIGSQQKASCAATGSRRHRIRE